MGTLGLEMQAVYLGTSSPCCSSCCLVGMAGTRNPLLSIWLRMGPFYLTELSKAVENRVTEIGGTACLFS